MSNLLAPKPDAKGRRGSWQPSAAQPTFFDDQYRRHSVQLSRNKASPLERFRKSITKIDAANVSKTLCARVFIQNLRSRN